MTTLEQAGADARRGTPQAERARERGIARTRHSIIATLLALTTIALLLVTEPQIGLTWDEPVYTAAGESYVGWLEQLAVAPTFARSQAGIDAFWEINHEHPPLDKLWSGLVWRAAGGLLEERAAHRLGNMLLVGALVAMLYLTVAGSYGRGAGLLAVAALLSMPRFFFHAHLAALDMPAAVSFFAVIALFWHARERRSPLWDVALGIAWGAALATKINAAFVLPVLGLWVVLFARRWRLVARLAAMSLLGPPVFIALWPWLYHDTWARLEAYIRFITVDHWKIDQWYFGQAYMPPPWHFPFVMAALVVPLTLLALSLVGLVRAGRDPRPGAPGWLWALGALMPLLALTTGRTMVYDNERLFMPTFPFIAALAGAGLAWLLGAIRERIARPALAGPAVALAVAAAFAPQVAQAASLYPHLLSYYSEAVGGLPGARRLGMETTYWCETYQGALAYLNEHAEEGALVWAEDWSHDVLVYYKLHGWLRPDLRIATVMNASSSLPGGNAQIEEARLREADYVLWHARESGMTNEVRRFVAGRAPLLTVERQGVTLMALYKNP